MAAKLRDERGDEVDDDAHPDQHNHEHDEACIRVHAIALLKDHLV